VTRDSIPRDDLYGELEVSRQASVAAIEAAYRRLVKEHHPDVARSDDVERIKRLNLAREWLTDLDRRRRYDVSRGMSPTSAIAHHSAGGDDAPSGTRRRPGQRSAGSVPDASSEPARSFGVNANEVRIFLASLRGLDSERARRVFDGRAVAHAKGYTTAKRVATQVGQSKRKSEWQLAREAASVIARGKLGDTTLTEQVVDVLADTAGAIAIRDLLTKSDYKTLLLPWTWKTAQVAAAPSKSRTTQAKAASSTPAPRPPSRAATRPLPPAPADPVAAAAEPGPALAPPVPRVSIADLGASPWQPVPQPEVAREPASAVATRVGRTVSTALAARPTWGRSAPARPGPERPGPERPIALRATPAARPTGVTPVFTPWRTRVPRWLAAGVALSVIVIAAVIADGFGRRPIDQRVAAMTDAPSLTAPGGTVDAVLPGASLEDPIPSDPGDEPQPAATGRPGGGPVAGATTPPDPTSPGTAPEPTPQPTPTPAPPATPAPTPEPMCTVVDLIGTPASKAADAWSDAGFTGLVSYWPVPPPNYRIGWQSLLGGTLAPCSGEITVRREAP
jgi:hypothetical protein